MDNGIYKKIHKIQSEVGRIKKDKKNPHFKNSYADINAVLEEILNPLNDAKVILVQPTFTKDSSNYLKTQLIDIEDGSLVESEMILPNGLDAQKTGSALTYYRRYMIVSLLGLQTVDDDGKAGSNSVKERKKPTKDMIEEIESLMNGSDTFKQQWLTYLSVNDFKFANYASIEKAINQIKG